MANDHSHNEPPRDREVIVTDGGGRRGGGDADTGDTTNIEAPELEVPDEAEVDVNVDDGGGEG